MIIKEYFKDSEISCKCGCGLLPDTASIERLYALRILYGKPIVVTSGARCKAHNRAVGGSGTSKHLIGAFDVKVPAKDEHLVIQLAMNIGFLGIGLNDNRFLHLDIHRDKPVIWSYHN